MCEGRGVPMHRRSVLEVVVVGDAVVCGQVRWLRRGSVVSVVTFSFFACCVLLPADVAGWRSMLAEIHVGNNHYRNGVQN